jgi:NagD protein
VTLHDHLELEDISSVLTDMDGVLVHEQHVIPGAADFIDQLESAGIGYMVFTNNSRFTARDLSARLATIGLKVSPDCIWTSALATAHFLDSQRSEGTAYVLGEAGLTTALHEVGYVLGDADPDYVVLGETRVYSFEKITKAIRLILAGSRFIATNPDPSGPSADGILPATGAVAALISRATGVEPYYIGKPNPLMMRWALRKLDAHSEHTVMIGDRMDTDVVSGLEAGMRTILVLSGMGTVADADRYPYKPTWIVPSVAALSIGASRGTRRQEKGVSGRSRRSPST